MCQIKRRIMNNQPYLVLLLLLWLLLVQYSFLSFFHFLVAFFSLVLSASLLISILFLVQSLILFLILFLNHQYVLYPPMVWNRLILIFLILNLSLCLLSLLWYLLLSQV